MPERVSQIRNVSELHSACLTLLLPRGVFITVIEKYHYRDEPKKKYTSPEPKDFKRLNKAVLGQKATNAAVSEAR